MITSQKSTSFGTFTFFANAEAFGQWLSVHHLREKELLVGFYKTTSGKPGITWPESVDQALCFGWIDGVRHSIDKDSYGIRFTPRKPSSIWSTVNIAKAEELIKDGLMQPAGLKAFEARDKLRTNLYSFEQKEAPKLSPELQRQFQAQTEAWQFFIAQAPSYQKTIIHWIMSAKKEETKIARLNQAITASGSGERL